MVSILASPLPRYGALADLYLTAATRALSSHNVHQRESAQGTGDLHAGDLRIKADAVFEMQTTDASRLLPSSSWSGERTRTDTMADRWISLFSCSFKAFLPLSRLVTVRGWDALFTRSPLANRFISGSMK